jgi:hypothetical protein
VKGLFAALALVTLSGCARGSETLVLDWQGSDEGLVMAQAAADEWASVCDAAILVGRGNGGAPVREVEGPVVVATHHMGLTSYDGERVAHIEISRYPGESFGLRHEFGHALGILDHVPSGVMRLERDDTAHVTPADCTLLPVR